MDEERSIRFGSGGVDVDVLADRLRLHQRRGHSTGCSRWPRRTRRRSTGGHDPRQLPNRWAATRWTGWSTSRHRRSRAPADRASAAVKRVCTAPASRCPGARAGPWRPRRRRPPAPAEPQVCTSFDGKWDALIENFNVFLRPAGSTQRPTALSFDGSEGNYYTFRSIAWSPDSKKLVAYHTRPGYDRQVHYIESSPTDQIQPKHSSILYRKPGDALDIAFPALFDVATKKETEIDHALFPNAYNLTPPVWWKDGRGFTFEYNQRGHQVYRVIEVDAQTGKARALIDEESKTFIYYNPMAEGLSGGHRYRHDLNDGKEIIWASERDGWEHLYLYDGITGKVKNQITKGDWVVRMVDRVDDDKRQIWFQAGGMNPGQDPYFAHYYRINFDGTGLTRLTEADGNHTLTFSSDRKYYVDTWSRVDLPPVAQLRRTEDRKVLLDLGKGDATALLAAGVKFPEVFVAKGRDGKTDIWGIIIRPTNFDPAKKYPVIEQIYAGPHGSFVPKTFSAVPRDAGAGRTRLHRGADRRHGHQQPLEGVPRRRLQESGRRRIPGSHPVAQGGGGEISVVRHQPRGHLSGPRQADRIRWAGCCSIPSSTRSWSPIAAATTTAWTRSGGTSSGWVGRVGPQYAASSNVDNAYRLQGKALIIIGEMDDNVDPASSLQVVDALVKANKHFDMLFIPGQNHGVGVLANQHYRDDYFVHHLLGVEPPDWNRVTLPAEPATEGGNWQGAVCHSMEGPWATLFSKSAISPAASAGGRSCAISAWTWGKARPSSCWDVAGPARLPCSRRSTG